jgi:hypothetical protein
MKTQSELALAPAQAPVPVVLTGQALMSLRDSGFSLPAAVAELVDNSIEARARSVKLVLEEAPGAGRKHVHRIIAIDDGVGMDEELRRCLQIGFSTRYMRKDTIGKYGVGAKLAALNFGTRVDVWSRTSGAVPWRHVFFDLKKAMDEEEQSGTFSSLEEPSEVELPNDLATLAPKESGTIVVWSSVDRLEHGRFAADFNGLVASLMEELARIFREFIDGGIRIEVNGTPLRAHDPLFLMSDTFADQVLTKANADKLTNLKKGALAHFEARVLLDQAIKVKDGEARMRVTLYPQEVTRRRGLGGDKLANQLRVPENEGAISFVRLGREIAYNNVPRIFGTAVRESDRFIGIEVAFTPDMDDLFGVRNVKRGVEPHGELREKIREKLRQVIPTARSLLEERWGEVSRREREHEGEHATILEAVADADKTMPKSRAPVVDEKRAKEELTSLAADTGRTSPEDQRTYVNRVKDLPFLIESVDFPGKMFIDVKHINNQVVIRLNTRHRFYKEIWAPLREMAERDAGAISGEDAVRTARRAAEGLALMVVAYGKAQSMSDAPEQYEDLTTFWGQFVDTLLGKVKDVI